jgi:hypothetical protein
MVEVKLKERPRILASWVGMLDHGLTPGEALETLTALPESVRLEAVQHLQAGKGARALAALGRAGLWDAAGERLMPYNPEDREQWRKTLYFLQTQAEEDEQHYRWRRRASLYPLLMTHAVAIGLCILFALHTEPGGLLTAFLTIVPLLLTAWFCGLFGVFGEKLLPSWSQPVVDRLPGLGQYCQSHALARFAAFAEGSLQLGKDVSQALRTAGLASSRADFYAAAEDLAQRAENQQPPGLYMHAHLCFPEDFAHTVRKGENEEDLQGHFEFLARQQAEKARQSLAHFFFWLPKIAVAVALGLTLLW